MEPGAECYNLQNKMCIGESTAMCAVQNEESTASGVTSLRLIIKKMQLQKVSPFSFQYVASSSALSCGQTSWDAAATTAVAPSSLAEFFETQ
jgi:hypothetical protein